MHFAILGLLIVLVIAFFVVVWKASPHWRWYQIVAVSVTMLLAVIFMFPVAGVLKSRSKWHQVKEELEARLKKENDENELLRFGDPTNPNVGEGVLVLSQELSKVGVEAGRRWRNLRLQNSTENQVVLVKTRETVEPQVEPQEPAGAAEVVVPLVPEGMIVYGFAEGPSPDTQVPVPRRYLGEFLVEQSTPDQVTLKPTGELDPEQKQAITSQRATNWSLYELLPLDAHRPFIAEGSKPSDENIFGRVDEDLVKRLFTRNTQDPELQKVFDETLSQYLRDGSRATNDDPPETRWVLVEFTENHSIKVDGTNQSGALESGFFDESGRAVDSRLQRIDDDGEVRFEAGERLVVKEEAADRLRELGVAKAIDTYYVRPLNDYRYVLRHIRLALDGLANRKTELQFENQVLTNATDKTIALIQTEQEIRNKLEQDLAQTEVERKAIEQFQSSLAEEVKEARQKLVQLYRKNQRLQEELEQIHMTILQQADTVTEIE